MYTRVMQFSIASEKLDDFTAALNSAISLMQEQKGFQGLLVLRVEKSNPPDVRVMTFWDSEQALHDSENSLYFYQALSRVLTFAQGFPIMRDEEVVLYDFAKAGAKAASS